MMQAPPRAASEDRSARKCPACGSTGIARIVYGYPVYSSMELSPKKRGDFVLAGSCCVDDDSPAFRCHDCGHSFGRCRG